VEEGRVCGSVVTQPPRDSEVCNSVGEYKKSELMLIRRATASVQIRTQVVLIYLQYISGKIHSKCAPQPNIAKKSLKNPYFWGSRLFKVIDVGTPRKRVSSACYHTQQVCVYQVVLVYLEWFWRNSLLKCVLPPKIVKNSLKPYFGVQDRSRSSMLVPPEARQQCML